MDEIMLSRAVGLSDKKTEVVSVRVPEDVYNFLECRKRHCDLESIGEYLRRLIADDMNKSSDELNVLAEALGVKVYKENIGNGSGR